MNYREEKDKLRSKRWTEMPLDEVVAYNDGRVDVVCDRLDSLDKRLTRLEGSPRPGRSLVFDRTEDPAGETQHSWKSRRTFSDDWAFVKGLVIGVVAAMPIVVLLLLEGK